MAWNPQYDRSHFLFGAGDWSKYYWDDDYNGAATSELCLANCTTLAYGRVIENGYPPPVTRIRNANRWHEVVNTDGDWEVLDYISGMLLYPGDIIEYSENYHYSSGSYVEDNHVGVIEEQGTNPIQSSSWYTSRNESLSLQEISDYFQTSESLQYRFYHSTTLGTENAQSSDGNPPRYVLRYTGAPIGPRPQVSILPAEPSGEIGELEDSIDFRINITVSNIPSAESIAGNVYCDGMTFISESAWVYGSYTVEGVVYRYGTKVVDLRYYREYDRAYGTVKYLQLADTFSTGSINLNAPIWITVQAKNVNDLLQLKLMKRKKRMKYIVKI